MKRRWLFRIRHRIMRALSLLPFAVLKKAWQRWPRAWAMDDPEAWCIFLDADYWKWCRIDQRRHTA